MRAGGWVRLWAWILLLDLGCAATPSQRAMNSEAPAAAATQSPGVPLPPEPINDADPLLARLDGSDIRVRGQLAAQDADLAALVTAARHGTEVVRATASAGFSERALARLISASQAAGIKRFELEAGGHALSLALAESSSSSRARGAPQLIAWNAGATLSLYDLGSEQGATVSSPLQPGDAAVENSWREGIRQACGKKSCRIQAELMVDGAAGRLLKSLEALQRVTSPPSEVGLTVSVSAADTPVKGRLPPIVVQHIVRASYEGFQHCYESGLGRRADLTGRVSARFVIGRDGKVSNVADGGSDIPDAEVVSCVLKAFYPLQFPSPGSGIVTVVYPIMLSPG